MKHVLLVLSGKGGVGKSTFASQLAFTLAGKSFLLVQRRVPRLQCSFFPLAASGRNVGLLDVDICGPSVPRMLGLTEEKVHQSASGWSPVWLDEGLGVRTDSWAWVFRGFRCWLLFTALAYSAHCGSHCLCVLSKFTILRSWCDVQVMSIGFMLPREDDPIIWRGPRKNGLIKQFLTDVEWGALDYLIIDSACTLLVSLPSPTLPAITCSAAGHQRRAHLGGAVFEGARLGGWPQSNNRTAVQALSDHCDHSTGGVSLRVLSFLTRSASHSTPLQVAMSDVRKEINFCVKTGVRIDGVVSNMDGFLCPCE